MKIQKNKNHAVGQGLDGLLAIAAKPPMNKPSNGNDVINGSNKSEKIDGLSGNDSIMGLAGNDTLMGSAGNDTLNGGVGNDKLIGASGTDSLIGDVGNDSLDGGSENDVLNGGADNDTLNGGTGNDTMTGGTGNDTYFIDSTGDKIIEPDSSPAGGKDTVNSSVTLNITTVAGIENLTLTGTDNISATGNAQNNAIAGNKGNNALTGGIGNDTLDGGAGNDTLDGGTGIDKLIGGTGNDTYIVNNTEDSIIEQKTGGDRDTISTGGNFTLPDNIEVLTLTGSLDSIGSGNKLANTLNGNSGKNSLSGGQGNDTLLGNAGDDTLDGGTGNNVLDGGDGIDTVILSGPQSSYQLTEDSTDHIIRVKDITKKGNTQNELHHVESLVFADATLDVTNGLPKNLTLTASDVTMAEGNSGTKAAAFKLTLSTAPSTPVIINYKSIDGDALAGEDYTAVQGSITFNKGETSKTVNVNVLGDSKVESDEQFSLQFSLPDHVTMDDNEAKATITNDDKPTLSIAGTAIDEGGDGESRDALILVSLSDAIGQDVSVSYTTANGTAKDDSDYAFTSGVLTFPAGETTQTINVPVIGDSLPESNETFRVHLSSPTNAKLDQTVDGIVTINDDDSVRPSISIIPNVSIAEKDSGSSNAEVTVTLSAASTQAVTVSYATSDGSATVNDDYIAATGTVSFAPGETSKTIKISVLGDTRVESDETVNLQLSSPSNATLSSASSSILTINNDDVLVLPTLSITPTLAQTEGNSGSSKAGLTVTLSAAATQPVTVSYSTIEGTATADNDYVSTANTLIFAPGETSKTINVPLIGDTTVENDETFNVQLSDPSNASLGAVSSSLVTITNDDVATVIPSLSIASNLSITEGNTGSSTADVSVTLSTASTQTVTVNYAASDGTATAGTDYTATSGSLTFAPGETSKAISVPILGDTAVETDETFNLALSAPTNATLTTASSSVVTINNDDSSGSTAVDTSIVVFDLVGGTSSSHSNRTFDPDVSYTIYIRVPSDHSQLRTDANSGHGNYGIWSGAESLGEDDKIILAGNNPANDIKGFTKNNYPWCGQVEQQMQWGGQGNATSPAHAGYALTAYGGFARWVFSSSNIKIQFASTVLFTGTHFYQSTTFLPNFNDYYARIVPVGIMTSQGLA